MYAGEYLAVINAQRKLKDGGTVTGSSDCVMTIREGGTRYEAMRALCQMLDEKFFLPTFGDRVITDIPPVVTFLYIEPN